MSFLLLSLVWLLVFAARAVEPPLDWIEPATGHRVLRLSREPGTASLYFHQNGYSADGQDLVVTTRNGISRINLGTREVDEVVAGRPRVLVTGRRSGQVYFLRGWALFAANLRMHAEREVIELPEFARRGGGNITINADESLAVGIAADPEGTPAPRELPAGYGDDTLARRWAAGLPLVLYTLDLQDGRVRRLHACHDWLNHLQCSPTDPNQIMFCHEGPWHFVDRIWLIRADGRGLTNIHRRTMDMEIAGHEFFSPDGRTVWYDLQTPRSEVFWLAGYEIATGERTWYHLARENWSVHYNVSPDGKLFAGDGGGPNSVANRGPDRKALQPPGNGPWIYLFRPEKLAMTGLPRAGKALVKPGVLRAERLVDLSKHNYSLEPNVTFTPDGKWIVFRSNMHGPTHVYAVEVEKTYVNHAR